MPSALSAPTCGSTSWSGACITRTSRERKAKQTIIASTRVIAILTTVHRRSSRCSRNGLDVSLSGNSRNLKTSRKAMSGSVRVQRNETARRESGTDGNCIRVANFVVGDHSSNLRNAKRAAVENRFGLLLLVATRATLDRPRQKEVAIFVGEPG